MSVDLEVFSKARPDLAKPLGSVKFEYMGVRRDSDFFSWSNPLDRKENVHSVDVTVPRAPGYYSRDIQDVLKMNGSSIAAVTDNRILNIPAAFLDRVRDKRQFTADMPTYEYLQSNPELIQELPELALFWGVLKFGKGQLLYNMHLQTQIWANQRTVAMLCNLSGILVQDYDGLIWNPQTGKFGHSNPRDMFQRSNSFFSGLKAQMDIDHLTSTELPE